MARGAIIALFVVASSLGGARAAAAGSRCTAVARVSGAPVLVGPVLALLRERGVPVEGASSCGAISAVVASEDEHVRVTIIDGDGRIVERVVDDVEGAATAVESWARGDLTDPLLAAREAPARPAVDREAPQPIEIEDGSRATVSGRQVTVGALVEMALSNDGALWAGLRAQGCVELGPICAGALFRYAVDTENGGLAEDKLSHRQAIDAMATAELPIDIDRGRFAVAPGLALGLGALRAQRTEVCDECEDEAVGLLMRGQIAASARLGRSWSVRLDLAFGWAPYAEEQIGETDMDANDEPFLAGQPTRLYAAGLGLVYGGP
jgi:hypothetical protein